jgi:RHS repeat-associated protein
MRATPKYNPTTMQNYYAFGMLKLDWDGNCMVTGKYRYGFNTQEKCDEIAGAGNHNTAKFWEYDTRLGRRWNLDPVDQVSISNYACLGNNPISKKDKNGDTWVIGAIVGAVKAGVEFTSQVTSTMAQGK